MLYGLTRQGHLLVCSTGLLVRHLEEKELQQLLTKLCERCTRVGKKGEGRDIAAMGLKAAVSSTAGEEQAVVVVDNVVPTLVQGMQTKVLPPSAVAPVLLPNGLPRCNPRML